jgi:hypothetical protein
MITLGLDRLFGKYLMYKWRRRQIRLTEYLFSGSPKYAKLREEVTKVKERLDRIIVTQLYIL